MQYFRGSEYCAVAVALLSEIFILEFLFHIVNLNKKITKILSKLSSRNITDPQKWPHVQYNIVQMIVCCIDCIFEGYYQLVIFGN